MLKKASTVSIDLTSGLVLQSEPVYARDNLFITLTNTGSLVVSNARAALYRGNLQGVDGTLVATCQTFTVDGSTMEGTMSLNTQELVDAFTDMESVRQGEKGMFTLLIYDGDADVYIIFDQIHVAYEYTLAAGTPPNVSPITPSVISFGSLRLYNGDLYRYNETDGLWYKWTAEGSGDTVHEVLADNGISL